MRIINILQKKVIQALCILTSSSSDMNNGVLCNLDGVKANLFVLVMEDDGANAVTS